MLNAIGHMIYIPMLLVIVVLPIVVGYRWARRRQCRPVRSIYAAIVAGSVMAAWFALSWFSRKYADTDGFGWVAAEWWAHSGRWYTFAVLMLLGLGFAFGMEEDRPRSSRTILCSCAVLLVVWTTVWRTIPVYTFLPRSVERDDEGYMRQTVEYTCAPVSLANLMERFLGQTNVTEREMARLSWTTYEGTTVSGLVRAARKSGLRIIACRTMSMPELERTGSPAIVSISTIPEVHHATLFVGFDGDFAMFIDPSYGLWSTSRDRFSQIWYGKTLILGR